MGYLLTAIPVPELGIVAFKPGINQLHHFSGRMLIMSAPDELRDTKAGKIEESAVLNLVIDACPPASLMKIPKLKRWESPQYLHWVKSRPCCACGKQADDPHHLINLGNAGIGTKAHDIETIPLCRIHHNQLHQDLTAWQLKYGAQLQLWHQFVRHSFGMGVFGY